MAIDGFVPKITPPTNYDNYRQGDGIGIIYTGPNGKKLGFACDLFQGGEATNAIARWFMKNGVKQIDICVLTHGHSDHGDGIFRMVDGGNVSIREVLCYHPESLRHGVNNTSNGRAVSSDIDYMYKLIRHVQSKGTLVHFIDHGSTVHFGDISFEVYREQPRSFTEEDQGNGWAFVNNGSLVLCSPEIRIVLPGDGPDELKRALNYFNHPIVALDIPHHGGSCSRSNAQEAKNRSCVIAWESSIEKNGVGTSEHCQFGSRRVKEQGIPVWMQNEDIYFHADNKTITFTQGSKKITASIPYTGSGEEFKMGWVNDSKGWRYFDKNGKAMTGWHKLKWSGGTHWFFFKPDGYMVTGWQYLDWSKGKNWFFFDVKNGYMKTGWIFVGNLWYYLNPDTGAMQTGWLSWKNKWCYLEPASGKNQGHCYVNCVATIGGKVYSFDKEGYATEQNTTSKLNGCDVASYQYDIDPSAMTTTDFVIVKMTQGTWYTNPYADQQYSKAKAAGKLLGAYHYAEGGDPVKEAQYFIAKVGKRVGECILALDWEGKSNSKFNKTDEVAWVLKFAMEVYRLTGAHIFLYVSKSVTWRRNWSEVAKDVRLWCAQYANSNNTNYLENPWTDSNSFGAWNRDTIRQYSSHGRVRGYSKNLDINKAYMSRNEWLSAASGKIVQEPAVTEKPKTQWADCVSQTTSPVKISNSGSDENGNYKNGKAGDQNGREWYIRDWYNRPWNCVLRHPLAEVRACIATLAYKAARNDNIGYDQSQRDTYGQALAKADYDPSKITTPVESDCSKGVIDNVKAAGYILGMTELQRVDATYTGNMRSGFSKAGFIVLTESKYLTSGDYLLAGDILLNDAHHTATVVTNGTKSSGQTTTMPLVKDGSQGYAVSQLQSMLNKVSYRNQKKLEVDGSFGPQTKAQVIFYQMDRGLDPDGEVGPLTWGRLYEDVY